MAYHNKVHAKNKLDKVQVMYKGNQFFLIDNINIEKISTNGNIKDI